MITENRIAERIAAESTELVRLLPPEVYAIVRKYRYETQGDILDTLKKHRGLEIRLLKSRGGDPARRGQEDGWVLAINDRIKPEHYSDPGETRTVDNIKRWNYKRNHIELAEFERVWWSLD